MSLTVRPWRTTARAWHPRLLRWVEKGELVPACLVGPGLERTPGLWLAQYGKHQGGADTPLQAAANVLAAASRHAQESA